MSSSYCMNDGASQIARLKEEIEGLTCALNFAVLGGEGEASQLQYARRLNSKLEIARDELECAIEDQRIFLSSARKKRDTTDDCEASVNSFSHTIPTPPLSAPPRLKQDVVALVPELPNIAPLPSTNASSSSTADVKRLVPTASNRAERQRRSSFDDAPKPAPSHKYSLEWFKQRMVEEELEKEKTRKAKSRKRGGHHKLYSRKDSTTSITSASSDNDSDAIEGLRLRLNCCPKFSLEWFTLKKELDRIDKAKAKRSEGGSKVDKAKRREGSESSGSQQRVRPHPRHTSDEKLNQLNRKLDTATKFSLEYFELKKRINSLTR